LRKKKSKVVEQDNPSSDGVETLEPAVVDVEVLDEVSIENGVLPDGDVEILPKDVPLELDDDSEEEVESDSRALRRYDGFEAYLREIRRYPPLSKEEEKALAVRYFEHKDLEAAYKLVSANLWLVVKIAKEYERAARSILDLVQEGNIGLMEAVKNFDPYRGVRFPSYAVWWIRAYVIRFVIANWRLVKIGTTQAQRRLFFNLQREKEKLEREGFVPAPKLLAEKLNVKESEIVEMEQRLGSSDVSVDAPLQDDSESNLLGLLPAQGLNAEDLVAQEQIRKMIVSSFDEFAATLNEKEQTIFRERLLNEEKATLHDVAEKFSLSKERVRQIENRVKEKLKKFLTDKFGANVDQLS
jgi:RNA polymerase sigma-32 factor